MGELTTRERLQPCLLDRLTDEDPRSSKEGRDKRVFSLRQVRRAVLRDLNWLLNTPTRLDEDELNAHPEIRTSVLNYGLPDLSGTTINGLNLMEVEQTVQKAIQAFEPRILRNSLSVRAHADAETMGLTALTFEIVGDLWAQPVPDPLYIKTDVDLSTGQCVVQERAGG